MTLTKKDDDGIYVDDSVLETLADCDGIIFDCDGVLIDITKSYDLTINKTTQFYNNINALCIIIQQLDNSLGMRNTTLRSCESDVSVMNRVVNGGSASPDASDG